MIAENGDFIKAKIISGKQIGEGGPVLDEINKEAFRKIQELTMSDFPKSQLDFKNGNIFKK
jgi:hypothetical protein